jgi:hypothetical protein
MSNLDKKYIRNIIKQYPDDIEAQIRSVRHSFKVPRGMAVAILENFNWA